MKEESCSGHYLDAANNLRRMLQTIGLSPRQIDVTPI